MEVLAPWGGLGYGLVASTTNLSLTASTSNLSLVTYTARANVWTVQDTLTFEAWVYVSRGTTTTAANLVVELLVNGSVARTATIAITTTASQNRFAHILAHSTCRLVGVSGGQQIGMKVDHDVAGTAGTVARSLDPAPSTSHPTTNLLNTTIATSYELRVRMSAVVTGLTVYCTHALISRTK